MVADSHLQAEMGWWHQDNSPALQHLPPLTTTMPAGDVAGAIIIIDSVQTMQGKATSLSLKGESLRLKALSMT